MDLNRLRIAHTVPSRTPEVHHPRRGLTIKDLKKLGIATLSLATACAQAGGAEQPVASATPFKDNKPAYPPTPTYKDFTSTGAWLSAFDRLNLGLRSNLEILTRAIPDPFIRNRVAQVLIENELAVTSNGKLSLFNLLFDSGRVIGTDLCGDSRVICKTAFYSASEGSDIVTVEQRALGAAPRVFDQGINVSILATHCNSVGDPSGCGAFAGLAQLEQAGGYNALRAHGISDNTIRLIQDSLKSADPEQQAVIAAKIQAMINSNAHGGAGHISVAIEIGHADGSIKVLGAYDQFGNLVKIPDVVKDFIAFNNNPSLSADAALVKGQAPIEFALNGTRFNTQDLMGKLATEPGHTFKITVQSQSGNANQLLNVTEIDQGIAGIEYPLAHSNWGKLQWVFGKSPEELALMRERLMMSDKTWEFLGRNGVIVEALVDDTGKITGALRVTQLSQLPTTVKTVDALKQIGVASIEIKLSQKTLAEAEILAAEANNANASKWSPLIKNLKTMGKVGLKILKVLQPLFDAGLVIGAADTFQQLNDWDAVFDHHSSLFTDGRTGDITKVITDREYYDLLAQYPNIEPYMYAGLYKTTYTQEQLGRSFLGLVNKFTTDVSVFGGDWTNGPKNNKSVFYGMGIGDLYKVLAFDYVDFNDKTIHTKQFVKTGKPLIFLPLPVQTSVSPKNWDLTEQGIVKQPFMVLNTETGEFLTTVTPGEMIVPVESLQPRNPNIKVIYYLHLKSDGAGRIAVVPVGYKEVPVGK